jgi:hypothetical protein
MFESTKPGAYAEDRKAKIKNHNLPILQYMYMGSRDTPLACLVSKTPAFVTTPDFGNPGQTKLRFRIDFNHIRQWSSDTRQSGTSLDKGTRIPSAIFRDARFDSDLVHHAEYLIEFMTIMPVCTEMHSYISQDSAKNNITLTSFDTSMWPWVLQSAENFRQFCGDLDIPGLDYHAFIDHLSDIDHPPLQDRLKWSRALGFRLT